MRKLFLILCVIISVYTLKAQQIEYKDSLCYFKGKLFTGIYNEYFDNGRIKGTFHVQDGLLNNISYVYWENCNKKEERSYLMGVKHGEWQTWNEDNVKTGQAYYSNGLKDSVWSIWDVNGIKRYEMHYNKGMNVGTWTMWDESGNITMKKDY